MDPPGRRLRAIALAVIRRGDEILVQEGYDPTTAETFFRPLGGGIHFGERGAEAIHRELEEEISAEVEEPRYLGMLENLFVYDGRPGHELCLIYETALRHPTLFGSVTVNGRETDGSPFVARWRRIADFVGTERLYPDGLLDLLGSTTR